MSRSVDLPDHTAAPGMWSYSCDCLRCRWEQFWNEDDPEVIPEPDAPYPSDEQVRAIIEGRA